MPNLDATAQTAVSGPAFAPAFFVYLDINGNPQRFTTFGQTVTFSGTGDADLDGFTFEAFDGRFIEIGDVANSENGSDTLECSLSGIASIDSALINDIGNKPLWQGRPCRIWFQVYDETGTVKQGAIVPYYTGYMSSVRIVAEPEQQLIQLAVENWLAAFNAPSNRTYMNQKDYDAADVSAAATMAAANGLRRDTGATGNLGTGDFANGGVGYAHGGGVSTSPSIYQGPVYDENKRVY